MQHIPNIAYAHQQTIMSMTCVTLPLAFVTPSRDLRTGFLLATDTRNTNTSYTHATPS